MQTQNIQFVVGDCKDAFCQSDELNKKAGRLYVSPCEGLSLDKLVLLEVINRYMDWMMYL